MSRNQILLLAALGVFLLVVVIGGAIIALPLIVGSRVVTQVPVTETEPVIDFATGTPIVIVVTATPGAVSTNTAIPSATTLPTGVPSATAQPTATTVPTATPVPVPCDWASFVSDITIKDGTDFAPGIDFVKTWRIRNIGSCTWTTDYDLVFSSGNSMGAATVIALPGTVKPGETIDISVSMEAPDDEGAYTGYWLLRNPSGGSFGIGDARNKPIWVTIDVILPCYWVGFVKDVTIPDDTSFSPGVSFVKTWRLENIGDCNWTTSFDVIWSSGDKMGATVVDMPEKVEPGETVDISVTFTSPEDPGDYRGYWLIKAADGTIFGMGDDQDNPFWVDIKVIESENDFRFDFAANFCSATWKSQEGTLPCPGTAQDPDGFVRKLNNPALENRTENEPALWTAPDDDNDGFITGTFPAFLIEDGDHFRAWVGCLDGAEDCDVTFYLDYRIGNGDVVRLGEWDEVYDGDVTVLDIDLSGLDGKNVTFILSVEVNGGDPSDAEAFWFVPRIEQD